MSWGTVTLGGGGSKKTSSSSSSSKGLRTYDPVGPKPQSSAPPPLPKVPGGAGGGFPSSAPRPATAYSGGGGARTSGGGTQNTAQISPYLQRALARYEGRFGKDVTERAIGKSNLGIADAAALMAADAKGNMARRGVVGTGTGDVFLQKRVFQPAQRAAAGAASDIALQRERDLDALSVGGTGLVTSPDSVSLANRDLGLRQLESDRMDEFRRAQMAQSQADQDMALWIAMMDRASNPY